VQPDPCESLARKRSRTLPSHNFFIEQCIRLLYQRTTCLEVMHKRAKESKIILIRQTIKVFNYSILKTTKKAQELIKQLIDYLERRAKVQSLKSHKPRLGLASPNHTYK